MKLLAAALALALGACAGRELDTCDPGYVAVKLQAMALECRTQRLQQCPGVNQDDFEQDPSTCPALVVCLDAIDKEEVRCVGR